MQKYISYPPGSGTAISKQLVVAASMLLLFVNAEKSTRHRVEAYFPVPGVAKPQPAVAGFTNGSP
jgi:hypothetical protein